MPRRADRRGEQDPYRARGRKDPIDFRPFGSAPFEDEEEGEVFIEEATRVLIGEAMACLMPKKRKRLK